MKHIVLFMMLLAIFIIAACGGTNPAPADAVSGEAYTSPNLDTSYENALSVRLQLNLGSLNLSETDTPLTPEQAAVMLPLWQGLSNMTRSGNSAQAEVNALLGQIEGAFTPEQLTAIRNMELTSADIQTWAVANNAASGSGSGQAGSGQGGGSGVSPEERATRQAAEGGAQSSTSGNGVSTSLLNALISSLQTLSGQ